ncbi:hypothetical protein PPL_03993 [Heterostelium album PN500]|uniref:Uncharacterized protein n=1 Tax=Heterostelium pallidum (strain ATCC 26659 / Pp 5 / PN500) TaxID=670386 RepID=D3B5Q5_HETP5|nr:hypothetical protein PPL_03993 [Heterostelium album PN500]EFA83203.1 hypothetical protein PPL_03993 [Heterostelium album PN500]|eukprot:XP_020435320.1 hypothetical protein PPL_03993 [Heterostelium album PN500]
MILSSAGIAPVIVVFPIDFTNAVLSLGVLVDVGVGGFIKSPDDPDSGVDAAELVQLGELLELVSSVGDAETAIVATESAGADCDVPIIDGLLFFPEEGTIFFCIVFEHDIVFIKSIHFLWQTIPHCEHLYE